MKKNKMMRLASLLLVLVLMTSSVVGGTFAKYVTRGSAQDSARVAEWGVEVVATSDMFAKTYEKTDSSFSLVTDTVISNGLHDTINDVVAPGTKKDDASAITITGTPEVATRITYSATVTLDGWVAPDNTFYCPLIFTLTNKEDAVLAKITGANYNSAAELKDAIENAVAGFSGEYYPNTVLGNQPKTELHLAWEWPFSLSEELDVKDTYLGDQADDGNYATVDVKLNVIVEQVD